MSDFITTLLALRANDWMRQSNAARASEALKVPPPAPSAPAPLTRPEATVLSDLSEIDWAIIAAVAVFILLCFI